MTQGRPVRSRSEIERFARQTLVDHGLLKIPVNPVVLAEALGIRVSHAVFSQSNVAGMTARRSGVTSVLVRQSDSPLRKRFTVAHELGHCLLHLTDTTQEIIDTDDDFFRSEYTPEAAWSVTRIREVEANMFAASLLMPRDEVLRFWREIPDHDRSITTMAQVFQVSEEAMGYRMNSIGGL